MKEKWLKIKDNPPPTNKRIRLQRRIYGSGAPERQGWETVGWLTKGGIWSLRKPKQGDFPPATPTHWKPLTT